MISKDKLEKLKELSPQEYEAALLILKQYAENGESEFFDELKYADFEEIPVDIDTFLDDDDYLGHGIWQVDEYTGDRKCTLFPYWRAALKRLFPDNLTTAYNTLILTGAIGLGKAQPLTSLVLTKDGFKQMGELTLEDKVFSTDGKLHNILGIFPQGRKKICKVSFTDDTSTLCCDEHLWTVYDTKNKYWATIETKQLIKELKKVNNKLNYKIPMTAPIKFEEKLTRLDPYLLGILINNGKLPSLPDTLILDSYKKEASSHTDLKNKYIPDEYLYNSVEARIALLQGLLDANGRVTKNGTKIEFKTVNKKLKNDFIILIQSLGGICHTTIEHPYYKNKKGEKIYEPESYSISISLPKTIYPFRLKSKKDRLSEKIAEPFRYISRIEYVDEDDCQCIYVDCPEHLYLTNDFIATHNTLMGVLAQLYLLYRMLCLKDPYTYYGMMPSDKITFSMLNITLDAAQGVGWDKMQQLLQGSPWFMAHGNINASRTNPQWQPPKGVELIFGSNNRHVVGRALFCLDGDTKILTTDGSKKLVNLVDKPIKVISIDDQGNEVISDTCTVKPTICTDEEYQIELADGTTIKCTPNHRLMLIDGTYKEAQNLTENDELAEIQKPLDLPDTFIADYCNGFSYKKLQSKYNLSDYKVKSYVKQIKDFCPQKISSRSAKKIEAIDPTTLQGDYNILSVNDFKSKYNLGNKAYSSVCKMFKFSSKHESFESLLARIDKTTFCSDYFNTEIASKEILVKYNITNVAFRKLADYWELGKRYKIGNIIRKQTCLSLYGSDNISKTEQVRTKLKKLQIENNTALSPLYKQLKTNREEAIKFLTGHEKVFPVQLAEELKISVSAIYTWIKEFNLQEYFLAIPGFSAEEQELRNFLASLNLKCIYNDKTVLNGKELDIYIPEKQVAIEYNGIYWHSDLYRDKHYHEEKSLLCEQQGIRLIHIYSSEWKYNTDKIKQLLKIALGSVEERLYARSCEVRQITNTEAKALNEAVHLQGHRPATVTYGLFHNNKLVQLMSFTKTKNAAANGAEWEIIRGCPGSNNIVVGGVSKLFSHFIKDYKPKSIFSYCDFNKFNGNSYEALGMHYLGLTGPDKHWVIKDTLIARNPHAYKELKNKALAILWGAGSKKYIWTAGGIE